MNIMIIVPHPDDEILAFGGVIQKHKKNGDNVVVHFIEKVSDSRKKTQVLHGKEACKKLNIGFKLKNITLTDKYFDKCVAYLENEIHTFKPDILYTVFYGDNNQEHEYIFKVVKIATRVWSKFLVKKIYMGEILSSTEQSPKLQQYAFLPTLYIPLTKNEVFQKIECMKLYKEEIQTWPHPRSAGGILNLAERRGSECKEEYAEAFVVLRDISEL